MALQHHMSNLSHTSLASYSTSYSELSQDHDSVSYDDLSQDDLPGEAKDFEPAKARFTAKNHFLPPDMDMEQLLQPDQAKRITGTKIIATIGPSCQSVEDLYSLLMAGASGARVDLTWGTLEYHKQSLRNLEAACKKAKKLCCTMVDTLGRTIKVRRQYQLDKGWPVHPDIIQVKKGQKLALTTRMNEEASQYVLPVTYDGFAKLVKLGDTFYVARYLVSGDDQASLYLEVQYIRGPDVICVAKNDATLDGLLTVFHTERSCNPALHVNRQTDLEVLCAYDKECLENVAKSGLDIDFLSLAYTSSAADVRTARSFLDSIGCATTKIIAKIETRQALMSLNEILQEADGIIMSRGNLGLDCPPEKMAMVQKTVIHSCNLTGKPVLITRVVDTMRNSPRPTRAEATDVANAVLDGVDGILLGAETLRGKYPKDTVAVINRICRSAEDVFDNLQHFETVAEAEEQLLEYKRTHKVAGTPGHGKLQAQPKPLKPKDLYHKVLAYDLPPGENTLTSTLSSTCLNHTAEEVMESKLESIASGAVRVADKVGASMLLVYTHTGGTSQMIAKYRPTMPIITLVVPHLCASGGLRWQLQGRAFARQCCLVRGLLPMLAAPSVHGDQILEEAVSLVAQSGLVKPSSYIVCVQRIHGDFCVKVVTIDKKGMGIQKQHDSRASLAVGYLNEDGVAVAPNSSGQMYLAPFEDGQSSLTDMSYSSLSPSFARR